MYIICLLGGPFDGMEFVTSGSPNQLFMLMNPAAMVLSEGHLYESQENLEDQVESQHIRMKYVGKRKMGGK